MPLSLTLQRAVLGTVVVALVAGLVPAALVLDHRLVAALEDRARNDLLLAPRILADRLAANADAMMMHAKELAHSSGLDAALSRGDRAAARTMLDAARSSLGGEPVLVGPRGEGWAGPGIDSALVARTRAGEMPVVVRRTGASINYIALAPVSRGGQWVGAAGVATAFDERLVGKLSGLTRAGVVLLADSIGPIASTLDSGTTVALAESFTGSTIGAAPGEVSVAGQRTVAIAAPLPGAGTIVFSRVLDGELAVLPELRRISGLAALGALLLAICLGAVLAATVSRPVRQLAGSASALASGDFSAPLPRSRIREVALVATTFDEMRRSLAARLEELGTANAALIDRSARLTALQTDLMQRELLAATGRLVVQLAHEIRNPVAALRNCLELIRRRVEDDPEALEFADLAIDELLRMHELAEQVLELNRPRNATALVCSPARVSRDVARLEMLGATTGLPSITVDGDDLVVASIRPDVLHQILLNLLKNAREAVTADESTAVSIQVRALAKTVSIDIRDTGPGIPADILERIFDPFFTTKAAQRGVGLGLFVADGLLRAAGGRITANNTPRTAEGQTGAAFHIELVRADVDRQPHSSVAGVA